MSSSFLGYLSVSIKILLKSKRVFYGVIVASWSILRVVSIRFQKWVRLVQSAKFYFKYKAGWLHSI